MSNNKFLALSRSQNHEAMKIKSKRDAFNYQICLNMFTDTFPDLKSKVTNAKDQLHFFDRKSVKNLLISNQFA